jgi:hypothetical protein
MTEARAFEYGAPAAAKSGDNNGTIRGDKWYLVVSRDVRQHRLISTDYVTSLPCHGTATWNERA